MYEYIKDMVKLLTKKYNTNNPFDIAAYEKIKIIREDLGSVDGYYSKIFNTKIIHINCNLSYNIQLYTCGHELAHALLHTQQNTIFLRNNTFFSVDKLEKEANLFTSFLLIPVEILQKYKNTTYSLKDVSASECIPFELLKLYISSND